MRTTANNDVAFAMDAPPHDATLVARLRATGAIIFGAIIPIACLVIEQVKDFAPDQIQLWRSYTGMGSFLASGVAMVVGSLLKPIRAEPEAVEPQGTAGGAA